MRRPFPAYEGDDSYVFVCYSHDDARFVYPEMKRLYEAEFNIWYDEGVSPGSEWSESLADHIQRCAVFLYFVTPRSVEREHCRQEINFALDQAKQILAVHLEPTEVPPALQLNLSHRQAILKYEHPIAAYQRKLDRALREATGGNEPVNAVPDQATAATASAPLRYGKYGAVALALLLVFVTGWWLSRGEPDESTTPTATMADHRDRPPTIAVLPLRNLSGDEDQAYFGEAVSSEIWAKLTRVDGLRVISMTSSSRYRDSSLDIREIGERLTADFVIEGSAILGNGVARVNVHLTDAVQGTELYGESYTAEVGEITALFGLYDKISKEVGASLPRIVQGEEALHTPTEIPTDSVAAYNLVKRAMFSFIETGDPRKSLALIEQALQLDPGYAAAHSDASSYLALMAEFGYGPPREYLALAEAAAERALTLDPEWGNAYVPLGFVYDRLYLDWSRAMKAYDRAAALGADSDELAGYMQDILLNAGRYQQGLQLVRDASARNPGMGSWHGHIGRFQFRLGRLDDARKSFERSVRLSPQNGWVMSMAFEHLLWMEDLDQAEELYANYIEPSGHPAAELLKAQIALKRGDLDPLRSVLADIADNREIQYVRAAVLSNSYFELGDYEQHIRWFGVRVQERDLLGWIKDELRRRPQYEQELAEWARADQDSMEQRVQMVDEHFDLLARTTKDMVL